MPGEQIGVLFVCLGNICRSPMAEGIFRSRIALRGVSARFLVDSAGTAGWHAGEPADPRTRRVLRARGCPDVGPARTLRRDDAERFDWILVMDRANLRDARKVVPEEARDRVRLVLETTNGGEVPDPYYGDVSGFDEVYALLDQAIDRWIERMLGAT